MPLNATHHSRYLCLTISDGNRGTSRTSDEDQIQNANKIGSMAIIPDFGINEGCIIGPEIKDWKNVDLFDIDVSIDIDGKVFGPTKPNSAFVGAYGAVKFLIEHMKANGKELPVGTMASTGAITGVHDINVGVGSKADVTFAGLGGFSIELVSNG